MAQKYLKSMFQNRTNHKSFVHEIFMVLGGFNKEDMPLSALIKK